MRCSIIGVVLLVGVGISGCASVNKLVNGDPKPSSQADVLTFQPLSIPPDYTLLPEATPAPVQSASAQDQTSATTAQGELQGTDQSASAQSQTLLSSLSSGGSASNPVASTDPSLSAGEQAFLDAASADKANPDIRELLATDSVSGEGLNKSLSDELILWNPAQQKEAPPSKGGSAGPTITRVEASPLSGIFN